ncbi:hypothetical protein [Aeromonas phage Akh-2]|nr:hypothetical protein [Aeromonas phage Akh-2]
MWMPGSGVLHPKQVVQTTSLTSERAYAQFVYWLLLLVGLN